MELSCIDCKTVELSCIDLYSPLHKQQLVLTAWLQHSTQLSLCRILLDYYREEDAMNEHSLCRMPMEFYSQLRPYLHKRVTVHKHNATTLYLLCVANYRKAKSIITLQLYLSMRCDQSIEFCRKILSECCSILRLQMRTR